MAHRVACGSASLAFHVRQAIVATLAALCVAATSLIAGCATGRDNTDLITLIGCGLLGAGVGLGTGSVGAGAATAGVCTGVGLAIHHYRSEQSRSSSEDQKVYGLELAPDATDPVVHIRRGIASPGQARPGGTVTVATDYSLSVPATIPSVEVTEDWLVKKDGKAFKTPGPHREQRSAGGWYAEAEIELPADMPPGTYTVEHNVSAGGRADVTTSTFVVS